MIHPKRSSLKDNILHHLFSNESLMTKQNDQTEWIYHKLKLCRHPWYCPLETAEHIVFDSPECQVYLFHLAKSAEKIIKSYRQNKPFLLSVTMVENFTKDWNSFLVSNVFMCKKTLKFSHSKTLLSYGITNLPNPLLSNICTFANSRKVHLSLFWSLLLIPRY